MSQVTKPALDELRSFCRTSGIGVRMDLLGAELTTFGIGGPISSLIEPKNISELCLIVERAVALDLESRVVGFGSNLLLPDLGFELPLIRLGYDFRMIVPLGGGLFRVGAGASLMNLSRNMSDLGFSGLEFAGGIPASFGGAIRMNAGAHGGEIGQLVEEVTAVNTTGQSLSLSQREIGFSYRNCSINDDWIITGGVIKLAQSEQALTAKLRAEYLSERKRRQPLSLPSAGSVFRNPFKELSAGQILEESGLKGSCVGGAKVSELHANWIVNPERKATAIDVQELIKRCQVAAKLSHQVDLVAELVVW